MTIAQNFESAIFGLYPFYLPCPNFFWLIKISFCNPNMFLFAEFLFEKMLNFLFIMFSGFVEWLKTIYGHDQPQQDTVTGEPRYLPTYLPIRIG